jgi:hypothetical protein
MKTMGVGGNLKAMGTRKPLGRYAGESNRGRTHVKALGQYVAEANWPSTHREGNMGGMYWKAMGAVRR